MCNIYIVPLKVSYSEMTIFVGLNSHAATGALAQIFITLIKVSLIEQSCPQNGLHHQLL